MARRPEPWWREQTQCYYVKIGGVQHRLDPDKDTAYDMFHKLMSEDAPTQDKLVGQLFGSFLAWCETNRPDSHDWYEHFLDLFFQANPDLTIRQIKPLHVSEFMDKKGWKGAERRGMVTAVKRAFNWAVKEGHLTASPIHALEKPEANVREQFIDLTYHKLILKNVNQQFADLCELAWETGARPFELYRLEDRHLDLKNSRAVYPKEEAKGKKKPRVIYFSKTALKIIKRNLREGRILRNTDGEPWTIHAINSVFARLAKKLKRPRLCLYTYRHSFAYRKLDEGTDSMIVATLMGHKDVQMLMKVYGHVHQNKQLLIASLK